MKDRFSNFDPEISDSAIDKNWERLKPRLAAKPSPISKGLTNLLKSVIASFTIVFSGLILVYFLSKKEISSTTSSPISLNKASDSTSFEKDTFKMERLLSKAHALAKASVKIKQTEVHKIIEKGIDVTQSVGVNSSTTNTSVKLDDIIGVAMAKSPGKNKLETTFQPYKLETSSLNHNVDNKRREHDSGREQWQKKSTPKKRSNRDILIGDNEKKVVDNHKKDTTNTLDLAYSTVSIEAEVKSGLQNIKERLALTSGQFHDSIKNLDTVRLSDSTQTKNAVDETQSLQTSSDVAQQNADEKTYKNRLYFELYAGYNLNQNRTSPNYMVTSSKNAGLSFGGGFGYKLSPRFGLEGAFVYNKNALEIVNNKKEIVNTSFIVVSEGFFSQSDSSLIIERDSSVSKYTSSNNYYYSAIFSNNYNYGLGINLKLLQKNKLSIDASLLYNLRVTKFNTEKVTHNDGNGQLISNEQTQYTLEVLPSYLIGSGNYTTTIGGKAPAQERTEIIKNKALYSSLLAPSVTFCYKINRHIILIAKPSYYINLTRNKLSFDDLFIHFTQNSLFFHFGLRLQL